MNRKQVAALAVIVAAAALVAWLALSSRQPPLLPRDEVHAPFESASACLTCHGEGGPFPRSKRHPLGEDCLRCHGRR
jgi:cytochrome c553